MQVATATASEESLTSEVTSLESFLALQPEWNRLCSGVKDEPFHRHEFLQAHLESFHAGAPLRILIRRGRDRGLAAALAVAPSRGLMCGVPVRRLVSLSNAHSCRFDLLAGDPGRDAAALLGHLLRGPWWDVLILKDVPQGGLGWRLLEEAARAGLPVGTWLSQRSPRMDLPPDPETLLSGLPTAFRQNLRRRRRRLEERGPVRMERVDGGPGLSERLSACLAVESQGWKGRLGTAIAQDRQVRAFYDRLAAAAAGHGYLSLYVLFLEERVVAFQYGLTYGGTYYLPKLAYDESLSECSPGLLLFQLVLEDCIRRGLRRVDFLGDATEWKLRWTRETLPHHWLYVFRDTRLGRGLHRAKFAWLPSFKRSLPWLRRTRL